MAISTESVIQVSENVQVITGVTNIGIIDGGSTGNVYCPELYLVDSGGDSGAGKKIYKTLEQLYPEGFILKAII